MSTGHQHHFLSRLDRVSLPHVERALSLYRDHDLVRFLLGHLTLPEGTARVAISLADPERGPFIIVTREGRFVTCLAEGMKPGRLPIVTRERLDGIAGKHEDLLARLDSARALGGVSGLFRRLYHAGENLSREEMIAASGIAPLFYREIFEFIVTAGKHLRDVRNTIYDLLHKTERPKALWHPVFEAYYKTFWCAQHLLVLFASVGREILEVLPDEALKKFGTWLTRMFFIHYHASHVPRALWSIGKLGRSLLPNYKAAWATAETGMEVVELALSLAAIGHRHKPTRAEVRKVIASMPPRFGRDDAGTPQHGLAEAMIQLTSKGFDSPEAAIAEQRLYGGKHAVWLAEEREIPTGHRYRFSRGEDVPDSIALPMALAIERCFLRSLPAVAPIFVSLPWMGRAKAEDLYLPRDYIDEVCTWSWDMDLTLRWFRDSVALEKEIHAMRPKPEGPARKDPCPCGSGKKYKRCCAAS